MSRPGPRPRPAAERLAGKVKRAGPDDCWPFDGATNGYGYGRLTVDGKPQAAHRLAYELEHGEIPAGLFVLHRCDNPPCCNPAHLYLGTHADNMRDMDERGRRVNRQARGAANGRAKLAVNDVVEIRRLASAGEPQRQIAEQFQITQAAVSSIVTRRTWKDC